MTPSSAASKLASAPRGALGMLVEVSSGVAKTVSCPVRKSAAGDGAAYTGNQPRMMVRANPALGLTTDTVLATYASGTGSFNTMSGSTPTPTDDGEFEVYFDCDGTAGWINVDVDGLAAV
jgi:hypothetical protein